MPPSPGEDPAAAAGATLPPLAWQDVDLQHECRGDASIDADAVDDDDYNDDGGDSNNGGRDLALALAQPHPHPHDGEGNHNASPPSWRLALDSETFDGLVHSAGFALADLGCALVAWARARVAPSQTRAALSWTWTAPLWLGLCPRSFGCAFVGTKGMKPTDRATEAPTPHKKVSWQDALFPRRPLVDVDL